MSTTAAGVDLGSIPSVLLVAEDGCSGGIGRYCLDQAEILGSAAAVVCLCPRPTGCESCWLKLHCEARGLRLFAIAMGPKEWRHARKALMALWRHAHYPVMHTNGRRGNFLAQLLSVTAKELSFVTTVHGVLGLHAKRNAAYRLVDLAASRSAAAVIAVSADTRRRLVGMGSPSSKTVCIPNGLRAADLDLLKRIATRRTRAEDYRAPIRVGFLGRLSLEKGIQDFAGMANRLHSSEKSLQFVVAGDGPLRESMLHEMDRLTREGVFKYVGEARDATEVLEGIDVLIMPSRNEGLPYVLLEGMAAGCAVAVYGVGGVPEVISDSSLGMIARPADPDGLFEGVLSLVQQPGLPREIGAHAAKHVEDHFRLEARIPMLLAAYEMSEPIRRGPLDVGPSEEGWFTRCA